MNYLTFSTEELSENQIKFLAILEVLFFKGHKQDLNLFEKALKKFGTYDSEMGAEFSEAWDYWNFSQRPLIRKSYKEPVLLDDLLKKSFKKNKGYWLKNAKVGIVQIKPKLKKLLEKSGVIYELSPHDYYFEMCGDKGDALHIKYQHIIGSRFIAYVK